MRDWLAVIRTPVFPNVPVLVLDENVFMRRTLRGMLEQASMRQVIEASDIVEAMAHLTRMKPGLIIMDWQPDTAPLLVMLRDPARSTQTTVPVIVTSDRPTERMVEAVARQNVDSLLKKPFSPKSLWKRIGRFFAIDAPPRPGEAMSTFQI
jgi:DNA-binding response OmpR family regulator